MHEIRDAAAGVTPRRLFVYNGGLLGGRVRRILDLAGWGPRLGLAGTGDLIGIWGAAGTAWRGRAIARRRGAGLVHVEDAFLRSILPGRARGALARRGPIGLIVDPCGLHFDPVTPSLIETLIASGATAPFHAQARTGIARLIAADLSKYNAHLPDWPPPEPGYVLVIDQTAGDAALMGADRDRFLQMLAAARAEHPRQRIVIRSHPETAQGLRPGHFTAADLLPGETICDGPVSPWSLLRGASAVYAVSSQLGYEAMLAGHRPRLFGLPFYAGWGLSDDEAAQPRRSPAPVEALFAASHLIAPIWYDPCRDALTDFDGALDQLEAEAKAFRQDHAGHLAYGIRLWKRPYIARAFGSVRPVRFTRRPSAAVTLVWANRADEVGPDALRVEDGFLRSRGLGAALIPPLSLVADQGGIYYDPGRPSALEALIAAPLPPGGAARAARLRQALIAAGLSKYNLGGDNHLPDGDGRPRILVPGQVEDDTSIRLGAGLERSNLALLKRVRAENPDAVLIYKPHPDVEAGLRPGAVAEQDLARLADHIARAADPVALLGQVDTVWTMTSTLGFEALLRGIPVTTLGAPFYAGWGLTRDLGPVPARRRARPDLDALTHAVLIGYPRYVDPISGLPCPPELALERLAASAVRQGRALRLLAKAQGALAGHAWIWRR
ncbi:capsular polysaccharide biosynthesis protein [Paracoccus sp. S1E-3]|uniref:capsular polysaccharide biosynthesis protein n=1 Tax=Paracoccus sp. S1E-3 TaxID=2756130 RepID=UPI0015EFD512|nr:capsular polysaccharide biosynthesis protein [Paracoccus sp. S1E-3]MBA4489287.1 capsular polysaccharide biosynthesis protein [Paracoccus sp. S1E-3]